MRYDRERLPDFVKVYKTDSLHPRNLHQARYPMDDLVAAVPALEAFVRPNPLGESTIDFTDAVAVKTLNQALLKHYYQVDYWDIPPGFLCPPIPGRVDYLHCLADLIKYPDEPIKGQPAPHILDIGTGANLIYPLLGHQVYGWHFVGSDIDKLALRNAKFILEANPKITKHVDLRQQKYTESVLDGVIRGSDRFAAVMCNPPFHASEEEANEVASEKWRKLGKQPNRRAGANIPPVLNFGGQSNELWCPGGEKQFLERMIMESPHFARQCGWFTSLISSKETLPGLCHLLRKEGATKVLVIEMKQGQKTSRMLAWQFEDSMPLYWDAEQPAEESAD
ncbi:23S rRNA (adenine(1618)-N(6))-methyltransferase RlmF [Leeia sp. TBRC 13508]|uniref:Ribosomal RNA large subunit methyltransferase F n=1 Tax=Leeia speluncae TaxID=2884804 RepID=A0ABS8D1L4_9NEIS|nr:23S rRNA (adenine(1618)-N(6))-methyltransferase RlmF [Leeia speluncae]MCB6182076.1 23S rRNA (adenine(1618)-N(6))-methyltransferase RlmF [Leeia speluncae]